MSFSIPAMSYSLIIRRKFCANGISDAETGRAVDLGSVISGLLALASYLVALI